MVEVRDVTFVYPGADRPALDGVSLSVAPGESVALLGANGSGKSTLARMCNALLLPTSGSVTVDGMDTADESALWDIRSRVGFVQQNPENQIVGTVAEEDVAFGPENLGVPSDELRQRVDAALEAVGLAGMQRREPHLLSEGQKQRLAIAGALAMRPAYLVLDEATAMLDPAGRADVLDVVRGLKASGVATLMISHHLADVADADRAVVLERGRVAYSGSVDALLDSPDRAAALGLDLPPMARLTARLRERGVDLPQRALLAEPVLEALWHS